MSLLSYERLVMLVADGVINPPLENINGTSIDITLSDIIFKEASLVIPKLVDLKAKSGLTLTAGRILEEGFPLYPGQFILASSQEIFNLPKNISAEYKLKSSIARSGLNHLLAGWCDPGWTNSTLTLELTNVTQNHVLLLKPGMKIGQMVFWECDPVPEEESYEHRGQYNHQSETTPSKGIR